MNSRLFSFSTGSVLCALVLLGAGCRGGGERATPPTPDPTAIFGTPAGEAATSSESIPPEGVSCNHEYYPLRAGYHIQYRTTYPASMGTSGNGRYALNVRRVTPTSVYLASAFERSGGGEPMQSDVEYRCIDGSLQAAGYVNMGGYSPAGPAGNYRVRTYRSEGVFLPQHINVGSVWSSNFTIKIMPPEGVDRDASLPEPVSMDVEIKRRALRLERVRVTAGEFEAMKIGTTIAFDGVQTISGTEWWVKDVGMVKSTMDAGSGTESIITEATGYTVPGLRDVVSPE